jgi:hypothetical protein
MKAFVCVYRHSVPSPNARSKTVAAALTTPCLNSYLSSYSLPNSFLDWGDDPSFFAAPQILGSASSASWGVCRRDVRAQLRQGDFVIWFCARPQSNQTGNWDYYLVGCTTVKDTCNRYALWTDPKYAPYRDFFNTLARPNGSALIQHEMIHDFHNDWKNRITADYIIFDGCPSLSAVNLASPTLVATGSAGAAEAWLRSNRKVLNIENMIFTNLGISRRLRTKNRQQPHRHIALHKAPVILKGNPGVLLSNLRRSVLALV